jgi:HlyD family secretion protein
MHLLGGENSMGDVELRDRTDDIEALLDLESSSARTGTFKRIAKLILLGGFAAALVGAIGYFYLGREQSSVRYVTEPLTRGALKVTVTATGSVQPTNKVDVSSELSGTVRRVLVDFNSVVRAGQPLAELDTEKLVAVVENSRAKLEAANARATVAEVTVRETEREYERKKALAGRNIATTHDLDTAQALYHRATATLASARADVDVTQADLKLNETNLAKACICSPINGIVLRRNVDPGQTVASSLQAPVLFSIAEDLTQMEVQVDVDEADVGHVRVGQSAAFSVDAFPDRKFPATIRDVRFASEVVQGVVTYKAVLTVDNSELLLRPGMTATAQISVQQFDDVLLAPNTALRFTPLATAPPQKLSLLRRFLPGPPQFRAPSPREETGPSRKLWVLKDGIPEAVTVVVGATDGRRTEIREGAVQPGQPVVVDSIAAKR